MATQYEYRVVRHEVAAPGTPQMSPEETYVTTLEADLNEYGRNGFRLAAKLGCQGRFHLILEREKR